MDATTPTKPAPPKEPTRQEITTAFLDAKTKGEREALAVQHPWLKQTFSTIHFQ